MNIELNGKDGQIYDQATGKTVALIPYFDAENEQQMKDQALFAAAPELLQALKDCQEWFYLNYKSKKIPLKGVGAPGCLETIQQAINKATQ